MITRDYDNPTVSDVLFLTLKLKKVFFSKYLLNFDEIDTFCWSRQLSKKSKYRQEKVQRLVF